jgi:hypothetical protein
MFPLYSRVTVLRTGKIRITGKCCRVPGRFLPGQNPCEDAKKVVKFKETAVGLS